MTLGRCLTGLELSEEEAFALLALCLASPYALDENSEKALRKLAAFCKSRTGLASHHSRPAHCELGEAV